MTSVHLRLGPFVGNLAEFRVWNMAKSASEAMVSAGSTCGKDWEKRRHRKWFQFEAHVLNPWTGCCLVAAKDVLA